MCMLYPFLTTWSIGSPGCPSKMKRNCVVLAFAALLPLHAAVITNGGFESGFTGWTRADQTGSDGTFAIQTGTASPVNADPVPAPPGGTKAAMTDSQGPGSHLLFQNLVIAAAVPTTILSFDLFIGNRGAEFDSPNSLDFSTPALNQQARVDLLLSGGDPFSVTVLQNLYQTHPGDALVSGYTHIAVDVTSVFNANVGNTLVLRFAETDNIAGFQMGVDNVSLDTLGAPEPASWAMLLIGVAILALARRRSVV